MPVTTLILLISTTGGGGSGSCEGLERARQTQCCSRIIHLAKLNPNCHMNYSIIFTEISFSPETSNLLTISILIITMSSFNHKGSLTMKLNRYEAFGAINNTG